jgi:hypothetical protein
MSNLRGEVGKGGPYLSGSDYFIKNILQELYGDDVVNYVEKHGLGGKIASAIDVDFEPLIKYAKDNGYDSLKFLDESFEGFSTDITYIIFDGSKIKIKHIYDITEYVDSGYETPPIKIK